MDIPDTEHGLRLKHALIPSSSLDKLAQTWAYASPLIKGAVLTGTVLTFSLLGLAFGSPILLLITSLVVGLSIHGLLVAHHVGRVKRIMGLVKEQQVLKEEVSDTLTSIHDEVVDFIQDQKKETQDSFVQFKKDVHELAKSATVVDEQVGVVVSVNKKLEEVGQDIETTLQEVDERALAWNNGLKCHQDVLGTVIDATHTFSSLVDDITSSHKAFDSTVGELHEVVSVLTKSSEASDDDACNFLRDLTVYAVQIDKINEQLNGFDMRFKQRKEKRMQETGLLIEESLLVAHREGIQAANDVLCQLEQQRKVRTINRATNEHMAQNILDAHRQESEKPCLLFREVRSIDRAWFESVQLSIGARQARIDTFKINRDAHHEERGLQEHQAFVDSIEADLKARAQQRKRKGMKNTELLVEDSLLVAYRGGVQATDDALCQLARQRKALATQRATHEQVFQNLLETHRQESEKLCALSSEVRSTECATWLESVNQSIGARQARKDALKQDRETHNEENGLQEQQPFVGSLEDDLKIRSEQRKARRAKLDAACRFFAESLQNVHIDDTSKLHVSELHVSVH